MHINTINSLASLEAILSNALKDSATTSTSTTNSSNSSSTSSSTTSNTTASTSTTDDGQLSLFAQLISMLQELQQSNSKEYQSVTQTIAANLQTAAQTAKSGGNTAEANQLSQLSADFTHASATGQIPDLQDLFQSLDGGTASSKASSDQNPLEQLLASFQTTSSQSQSSNPMSIILNTLTSSVKNGRQ